MRIGVWLCLILIFSCSEVEQGASDTPIVAETKAVSELSPERQRINEILANTQPNTQYSPYQPTKRTNDGTIPKEIEEQLIKQGEEMFVYLQAYDLEASDMYAPMIEEMAEYYKIFNTNAFNIKFGFFQKNYDVDGLKFGDNLEYDQDLIKRITARAAILRTRSLSLTKERVLINDDVEVDKIYVKPSKRHNDMYDIHVRFKKKDIKEYYEIVNEACWLNDRTCVYTQSWKFLGKYNSFTKYNKL